MKKQNQTPPFFDRRVVHAGYTRTVSLGKVIPEDWRYVRIYVIRKGKNEVELLIKKLVGVEANASPPKTKKGGR